MSDHNREQIPESRGSSSWNILQRRETKYELDVKSAKALRAMVSKELPPYEFRTGRPYTFITTIYFDTAALDFYQRATTHYDNSLKIRVKEYYYDLGNGTSIEDFSYCFVEIKQRLGGYVVKRRIRVPKRLLNRLFTGEDIWSDLVAFDSGIEFSDANDVYRDLRNYLTRLKIRPTSIINYRRSVFQKKEEELRVTFDDELLIFPPVTGLYDAVHSLTRHALGPPTGSINKVIMEIKCQGGLPGWLDTALRSYLPKRISKFTTSIDLLTEDLVSNNGGRGKAAARGDELESGGGHGHRRESDRHDGDRRESGNQIDPGNGHSEGQPSDGNGSGLHGSRDRGRPGARQDPLTGQAPDRSEEIH